MVTDENARTNWARPLKAMLLAGVAGMAATGAAAQTTSAGAGAEGDTAMEEIVVTALKRSTSLQTTPAAISAVTGQTLARMGVTDSQDLSKIAPGLIIRENPLGGARVTIRNIRAAGEPTVGVYYDETPIIGSSGVTNDSGSSTPDIRLFDVDRVEVLRGPQGTLYGAGSMAGTVRILFQQPKNNLYEGQITAQAADTAHGGHGGEVQGMVNLPLIEDRLAARVVAFYRDRDGYIDDSTLHLKNVNDQSSKGGRLMLRFTPSERLTLGAMAVVQTTRASINNWSLSAGPFDANYATLQPYDDDLHLYSLSAKWDLDFATVSANASYSRRKMAYNYDFSTYFTYVAGRLASGSAGQQLALSQAPSTAYSPQVTDTYTQEVRISSHEGGPLQWTAGVYNSRREGDIDSYVVAADKATGRMMTPLTEAATTAGGVTRPANVYYHRSVDDVLKQTAVFGEGTLSLGSKVDLTVGTRYFDYKKSVVGAVLVGNTLIGSAASAPALYKTQEDGWVSKLNLSYKATRDVLVYGEASRGYRPGGVNQVIGLPASLAPYQSDSLWNYELGTKTAWFGRRLTLNVDLFRIDWKNMQVTGTTGTQSNGSTFSFISNAGDARSQGVEFDANYQPMAGLQLQLSGSYIDAKLMSNQTSSVLNAPGLKGDKIPYVPEATLQGSIQYGWALGDDLQASVRTDVTYNSTSWTQFRRTNASLQKLPGFATVGARAGLESRGGGWSASVFVSNLFDELGLVEKGNSVIYGSATAVRAVSVTPRTIGFDLSKRF